MVKVYILSPPVSHHLVDRLKEAYGDRNVYSILDDYSSDELCTLAEEKADSDNVVVLIPLDRNSPFSSDSDQKLATCLQSLHKLKNVIIIPLLWDKSKLEDFSHRQSFKFIESLPTARIRETELASDTKKLITALNRLPDQKAVSRYLNKQARQGCLAIFSIQFLLFILVPLITSIFGAFIAPIIFEGALPSTRIPTTTIPSQIPDSTSTPTRTFTLSPTSTPTNTFTPSPTSTSTFTPTQIPSRIPTSTSTPMLPLQTVCQLRSQTDTEIEIYENATSTSNVIWNESDEILVAIFAVVYDEDEEKWYEVLLELDGENLSGFIKLDDVEIINFSECISE